MRLLNINFGVMTPTQLEYSRDRYVAPWLNLDALIKFARSAEKLGFNSIHMGDHIFLPTETLISLTALAMRTEKSEDCSNNS